MEPTVQTRFPRIVRRDTGPHTPSQRGYVGIAIFLAIVTSIEVAAYNFDIPTGLYVTLLVIMGIIKFSTVVAFFMHLRFDGRLLTYTFLTGLLTAFAIFCGVILSLHNLSAPLVH